jgi:aminopeptidase N
MPDTSHRQLLPTDVEPTHYHITVEPDLERFTFEGFVKIDCDVNVATDSITVHQRELLISEVTFRPAADGVAAIEASEITLKPKDQFAIFGFPEVLPTGNGSLEIKFKGTLNNQMAGFYRSKYKDSKGVDRHMACTQFEAIDARRCFPCWDEPARKAVFVITLVYDAALTGLSNMPEASSVMQKDGRRRATFMPTPKMSTYLVAIAVGELEFVSAQTKNGILCRVFCVPGSVEKCHYALACCVRCLDFYDEFFGVPYPLPKMDMIGSRTLRQVQWRTGGL